MVSNHMFWAKFGDYIVHEKLYRFHTLCVIDHLVSLARNKNGIHVIVGSLLQECQRQLHLHWISTCWYQCILRNIFEFSAMKVGVIVSVFKYLLYITDSMLEL